MHSKFSAENAWSPSLIKIRGAVDNLLVPRGPAYFKQLHAHMSMYSAAPKSPSLRVTPLPRLGDCTRL